MPVVIHQDILSFKNAFSAHILAHVNVHAHAHSDTIKMLPPVLIELKFIFSTFLHKAHHKYSVPTGQLHKSDGRADPYFAGLMLLLLNCYGKYGMCPAHHQILHSLSLI